MLAVDILRRKRAKNHFGLTWTGAGVGHRCLTLRRPSSDSGGFQVSSSIIGHIRCICHIIPDYHDASVNSLQILARM